eukprot:571727-Ditylum_brightwellii.AAC.1
MGFEESAARRALMAADSLEEAINDLLGEDFSRRGTEDDNEIDADDCSFDDCFFPDAQIMPSAPNLVEEQILNECLKQRKQIEHQNMSR